MSRMDALARSVFLFQGKKEEVAQDNSSPPSGARSQGTPRDVAGDHSRVIAYDERDDAAGAWYERRLPRLAVSPFVGRARQARYRVGRLAVDVLAAARLPAADLGGTSDPYVVTTVTGFALKPPKKPGDARTEWPEAVRGHHRTATVLRNLNPTWADEGADFDVWRHGAVLKVEVYDFKEFEKDPLLGTARVDLDPLANAGPVETWWALDKKGGVRLRLRYDVDPLAEAASVLWLDPKPVRPVPKFDLNAVYGHAVTVKNRLDPGIKTAKGLQALLKWTKPAESALAFAAAFLVALVVDNYFIIFHLAIVVFLLFTRREHLRALAREQRLRELFSEIDEDGSGRIDFDELRQALDLVAARGLAPPRDPAHTKRLFLRHARAAKADATDVFASAKKELDFQGFVKVEEALSFEQDLDVAAGEDGSATKVQRLARLRGGVRAVGVKVRLRRRRGKKEPPADDPAPGPRLLKGRSLYTVNTLANGSASGKKLGVAQKELALGVAQLDEIRDYLCWTRPDKTAKILAGNVVLALAHCIVAPHRVVPLYVMGAFCVLTEQFAGAEIAAARASRAVKRYRALVGGASTVGATTADAKADPALWSSVKQCSKSNQAAMTRALRDTIGNIFRRVDADGSGSLSRNEVVAYVEAEISCPKNCAKVSGRLVDAMQGVEGGLDVHAFTEVVLNSDVAEALLVSEFERQLPADGVACVKLPSSSLAFSHPTRLAARDDADGACLAYKRKAGYWTRVPFDRVTRVGHDPAKPHVLQVLHRDAKGKEQTLSFNLANAFYAAALIHVTQDHLADALGRGSRLSRGAGLAHHSTRSRCSIGVFEQTPPKERG